MRPPHAAPSLTDGDTHVDTRPDTLPMAAWPVVLGEREYVAALRRAHEAAGDTPVDHPESAATVFPGAPRWALAARYIPFASDPSRSDHTPFRPGILLPRVVAEVLGAIYADAPEVAPAESGVVLRGNPGPVRVWSEAPAPVWLLALVRAVERLPVPTVDGVMGLAAWPSTAACVLAGVLCRITTEEWAGLQAVGTMAPRSDTPQSDGGRVHKAIMHAAPVGVYFAVRPLVRALLATHLPGWLATQPTRAIGAAWQLPRAEHIGPVEALAALRDTADAMTRGAGWQDADNPAMERADLLYSTRDAAQWKRPAWQLRVLRGWGLPIQATIAQQEELAHLRAGIRFHAVDPTADGSLFDHPPAHAPPYPIRHLPLLRTVDNPVDNTFSTRTGLTLRPLAARVARESPAEAQDAWWCTLAWWRSAVALYENHQAALAKSREAAP